MALDYILFDPYIIIKNTAIGDVIMRNGKPYRQKTQQENKDDFKRAFICWLEKTLSLKKDHHFALLTETHICYASINFTVSSASVPPSSNITKEEAADWTKEISKYQIDDEVFDFIIQCIADKSSKALILFKHNNALFIFGDVVTILINKENEIPYEVAITGASIH